MYDFIVVGAGPAGACLASRLAWSNKKPKVLLIEAGSASDASNPNILSERWSSFMQYPNQNWGYMTAPQKHLNDRQLDYSRGKGLGGSTVINICCYTVGPKDDYDRWAREVDDSAYNWENAVRKRQNIESWDDALEEHQRIYADPDMTTHGTAGPVRVEYPKQLENQLAITMQAAKDCKLGFTLDSNDGNPLGLSSCPTSSRKGRRITAANAYLADIPENLVIEVNAHVTKLISNGNQITGVVANNTEYHASKDVILSTGAVDSPKLLMLSGIGDKDELTKLGIDPIHHLPGVGKNLEDHLFVAATWRTKENLTSWPKTFSNPENIKKARDQFVKHGTGPFSTCFHDLGIGFFKADNVLNTPEFFDLPSHVQQHIRQSTVPLWEIGTGAPPLTPLADPSQSYLTAATFVHCVQSRGTIKLASRNPGDAPIIDPNFFSHPFDRAVAIEAGKSLIDFIETPSLKDITIEPFIAPKSRSDEDILHFWKNYSISSWHPSCTAKMGKKEDSMACVDSDFRVYGLQNLRVVDLSVTPFLPNCHPQSIAYFIGETAAEKFIGEYGL